MEEVEEVEGVEEDTEDEHPMMATEEDHPRGVGVSIVGHIEVVPTQVLNVRYRGRGTSQQQVLLTSKMVANIAAEGV